MEVASMTSLEQLQPLIYPAEQVSYWPYLLLALFIAAAIAITVKVRVKKQTKASDDCSHNTQLRRQAKEQLQQLTPPADNELAGPWLQQVNMLLKRLCANSYPESGSHLLTGRQWLAFLDSRCPAAGLTRWMVLVDGGYQPECYMQPQAVQELLTALERWIDKHV